MRILVYISLALWISVGVVIFVWNMILEAQLVNNIVPTSRTSTGRPDLSF